MKNYLLTDFNTERWKGINFDNVKHNIQLVNERIGVLYGEVGNVEVGYPEKFKLSKVSHSITNIEFVNGKVYGDVEFLNNKYGKLADNLINNLNCKFSIRIKPGMIAFDKIISIEKIFTWDVIQQNEYENVEDSIGDFCKHMEYHNDYEYEYISCDSGEQNYRQYLDNKLNIGNTIEDIIKNVVYETLNKSKEVDMPNDIIETDNIGEVIEKLTILHTRMWYLEDSVGLATTDEEIASLKKKIDICFKQKRPKYVEAINKMIDKAIVDGKSLVEDSVKIYAGVKN